MKHISTKHDSWIGQQLFIKHVNPPRGHACRVVPSPPTPEVLPPTPILIENPEHHQEVVFCLPEKKHWTLAKALTIRIYNFPSQHFLCDNFLKFTIPIACMSC